MSEAQSRQLRQLLAEVGLPLDPDDEDRPPRHQARELGQAAAFRARDRDDWLEFFTERAAVGEYERGMSRVDAEDAARDLAGLPPREGQQDLRLGPGAPPDDRGETAEAAEERRLRWRGGARYVPDGESYW